MPKTNKKLSKKAISSAKIRHNFALQWCWNYERMQAAGYAYSMVPIINELYDTDDEKCQHLKRHMQFYNTHPGSSALIMGACVALEENYQYETGDSLKVALMGPLAGIGDTIQGVLISPTVGILAASLAAQGNYWLSLIVAIFPILALFLIRWPLFNYGYKKGVDVISDVGSTNTLDNLQIAASVLGLTVIGGFIPSILGSLRIKETFLQSNLYNEAGEIVQTSDSIQKGLDSLLPYFIPIIITFFCYWLIKKKKVTPLKTILIISIIAFIFGAIGAI